MRALIRYSGETLTEDMNFVFIEWNTGAPLTDRDWSGGPYTLVDDYVQGVPVEDYQEPEPIHSTPVEEKPVEQSPSTVTYGGKEYTLEELKKLIQ